MLPERLGKRRWDRDRPDAVLCLRVGDAKDEIHEVDVPPPEPLELVAPEPAQHEHEENRAGLLVGEGAGDEDDLGGA
jgi:hypothetical protein